MVCLRCTGVNPNVNVAGGHWDLTIKVLLKFCYVVVSFSVVNPYVNVCH